MSDWYGTCFASSLPIFQGEDCAVILMVKNPNFHGNNTYANDRFFPITAPIRGKYNGYGGITPIHDENFKILDSFIQENPSLLRLKDQLGTKKWDELCPVANLSEAVEHAAYGSLFQNEWPFLAQKETPAVELGLLHDKILSFAENEYQGAAKHAEDALSSLVKTVKEKGPLSPKILDCEDAMRYSLSDDGFVHSFLMRAIRRGYNPSSLAAVTRLLQAHRLRFIPGSGVGGQSGIETRRQLDYYKLIYQLAEGIFTRASEV